MTRTLEFYYDYGSPYSYLADTQVEAIARRAGAALVRKPMLLGGVFKATGNASPMTVELKSKWSAFDMPMWASHYGVPFQRNPFFPVNTLALMRGAAAAQIDGLFERYHPAIYKAMWVDGRNLNDIAEVASVLTAAGLDAAQVRRAASRTRTSRTGSRPRPTRRWRAASSARQPASWTI